MKSKQNASSAPSHVYDWTVNIWPDPVTGKTIYNLKMISQLLPWGYNIIKESINFLVTRYHQLLSLSNFLPINAFEHNLYQKNEKIARHGLFGDERIRNGWMARRRFISFENQSEITLWFNNGFGWIEYLWFMHHIIKEKVEMNVDGNLSFNIKYCSWILDT